MRLDPVRAVPAARPSRPARLWAWAALVAHVAFVLSWLLAALWQGPTYRVLAHSISDMYAVGAPHGWVLVTVITLCGAALLLFCGVSLWPSLRTAGWPAVVGCLLLALSIFGVGDLLTPFERLACRLADPGCSAAAQLANSGGRLDTALSTIGAACLIAAGFFLAAALQRVGGWRRWGGLAYTLTALLTVFFVATGLLGEAGLSGLFERLLAATGAAGVVLLALGVLRQGSPSTARQS